MIDLLGRSYDDEGLAAYFGDPSCVAGIRRFELREGRARGVRLTEVRTGSGLVFEVNESRGLDLGRMTFRGIPLSFCSCNGEVSPEFYEPVKDEWMRSFAGGMLVTGGLTHMGAASRDGDEELPLHGRISNIPAYGVAASRETDADGATVYSVSGSVRESKALSGNMVLHRTVTARQGENRLFIEDRIENQGFTDQELMVLYHFNVGHPVVDEGSRMLSRSLSVTPRDGLAAMRPERYDEYLAPSGGYGDVVYYHHLADSEGMATAALVNERIGLGVYLVFNTQELGCFTQWKYLEPGNYAAGLEPGTAYVGGRAEERAAGRVQVLPGRSSKYIGIEVGVLASNAEIEDYRRLYALN